MSVAASVLATNDQETMLIGNYRITEPLGTGGSASVFLGEHIYDGTKVAVKVLHNAENVSSVRQLQTEVCIVAQLQHPHIIRMLDYNMDEENPFLVMEYAPYGTLRTLHPFGTLLPLHTVIKYVKQIADALQYIHDQGYIHRDIKPENMLLTKDQHVVLSDFGIAVATEDERPEKDKVGTACYMAPEQIRGCPCVQSDQYSLAAVVYEWLCGEPPFMGTSLAVARQHLFTEAPSLRKRLRHFPVAVDNVIMQALSKEPSERFSSIQEFATMLEIACEVCIF